jgi:hypothetical protein
MNLEVYEVIGLDGRGEHGIVVCPRCEGTESS